MICTGRPGANSNWACGQCKSCRINQRRIWTARLLLESTLHPRVWFCTLTYAPEHLPTGGTLVPKHLTDWLKRFRKALEPDRIRYYAVGEYGDRSKRPHYHAVIYAPDRADIPDLVRSSWPLGLCDVQLAGPDSMAYVAGYCLKKITSWKEEAPGLVPEFARMSRMPGLGAGAVPSLAQALNTSAVSAEIAARGDVPSVMRLEGRLLPVGRYVKLRLRVSSGYPEVHPNYRLSAMLSRPILTTEERQQKRRESLAKARNVYRKKAERKL